METSPGPDLSARDLMSKVASPLAHKRGGDSRVGSKYSTTSIFSGQRHDRRKFSSSSTVRISEKHLPVPGTGSEHEHKDPFVLLGNAARRLRSLQAEIREVEALVNLVYRTHASNMQDAATPRDLGGSWRDEADASQSEECCSMAGGSVNMVSSLSSYTIPANLPGAPEGVRPRHSWHSSNSGGTAVQSALLCGQDKKFVRQMTRSAAERVVREVNPKNDNTSGSKGDRPKKERRMSMVYAFPDTGLMKERVLETLKRRDVSVANMYAKTGIFQRIAKSQLFEYGTLAVIAFNSLWIAIDTDFNDNTVLYRAPAIFQVMEHFFCTYFLFEWAVRFLACTHKWNVVKDRWFVFDSFLLAMMIFETWILTACFALFLAPTETGGTLNISAFKLLRVLRLTRMARIARLLRAFPEMFVLLKGLTSAARSVFLTLALLSIIIYMFAITFRQVTNDTYIGDRYFKTVAQSAVTLLLMGTLPDQAAIVHTMGVAHIAYGLLFLAFILLGSLTVMNMLVGVLVEVVSVVSAVEREEMTINFLRSKLSLMLNMTLADEDGNGFISQAEFKALLLRGEAVKMLQEVGVDVVALLDLSEFIFKDEVELSFGEFCEIILQFRGSNHATVKNIVDMRKFVTSELDQLFQDLTAREFVMANMLDNHFEQLRVRLQDSVQQVQAAEPAPPPRMLTPPTPPGGPDSDGEEDAGAPAARPFSRPPDEKIKRSGPKGIGCRPSMATKRKSAVPTSLLDDLAWAHHVPKAGHYSITEEEEV